jgi:crotonobetainyl-CoA:carnitine CoA-transferase CaiB-like acyl-CoA transferase
MQRPLDGLRVVDLTQMFAGPGTGMYLADMGADVVKVEPPDGGRDRAGEGVQPTFLVLNRGKRSVGLDLRSEQGRHVAHRLIERADILLVAWEPGHAERMGYGYEAMAALNPRLIYASITGWGHQGPLAQMRGYDRLMQAYTGIMAARRSQDGTPTESPIFIADMSIPMMLSYGIMLALWSRERTGKGQKVETSQVEAQIAMQSIYLVFPERGQAGTPEASEYRPTHTYRTADGEYLVLVPLTDAEWAGLWRCTELPELATDERVRTHAGRTDNVVLIHDALWPRFQELPLATWVERLTAENVPHFPVMTRHQFVEHPHAWENGMLAELDHPVAGRTKMMALPVRLSATPGAVTTPAPAFGQHTDEVLGELGFSTDEIAALRAQGAIR